MYPSQIWFWSEPKPDLGPSPGHDGTLTKCIQALYTRGLPSWRDIPGRRSHSIMYLVHIHTHTHTHIYNTETMSIIYGNTHTHTHTHTHMRGVYYNVHVFILCCCYWCCYLFLSPIFQECHASYVNAQHSWNFQDSDWKVTKCLKENFIFQTRISRKWRPLSTCETPHWKEEAKIRKFWKFGQGFPSEEE